MVSESKRQKAQPFADCTNTPPISRPRRSCGSYQSSKHRTPTKSLEKNPSINAKNRFVPATASSSSHRQNEDSCRVSNSSEQKFATPKADLPAVDTFWFSEDNEDEGQNIRVYSKRRQNEGRSSQVSSSCPPLGRAVLERHKTGKSFEPKNPSNNAEDSLTRTGDNQEKNDVSLSGNSNCKQSLSTPQPVLAAVESFHFPDDNEDTDFQNIRVKSILRQLEDRSFEGAPSSYPPLGRTALERRKRKGGIQYLQMRGSTLWKILSANNEITLQRLMLLSFRKKTCQMLINLKYNLLQGIN